jgi:hypothetical protein
MRLLLPILAGVAVGTQVPLLQQTNECSNVTVSQSLFDELDELAQIVDIAYCVGTPAPGIRKPFECLSRCKDFQDFELVTTWHTGYLLSNSCGYIALSHASSAKRLIVAFRGTYSVADTIADLSSIPQEYAPYPGPDDPGDGRDAPRCENCTVHMGFRDSWRSSKKIILPHIANMTRDYPGYRLVLVGHSLGGAVAALAGLELLARGHSPEVTTFGEPRVGNQAFADYLDGRFNLSASQDVDSKFRRVTHISDPVPLLPLDEWGFRPHSGEIFISKVSVPPELEDVRHCDGSRDKTCSAGPNSKWAEFPWGVPTRLKIWQLFFSHRDYFCSLGLCLPQA